MLHLIRFQVCFAGLLALSTYVTAGSAKSPHNKSTFEKAVVAVQMVFAGRYSKEEIGEIAAGDLNNDGIEDLAAILGSLDAPQLAVLYGSSSGRYRLGAISKNFCSARYHFVLTANARSIFAKTVHDLGPSSHTYQFASRGNKLVLIGLEESNLENEQADGYGKSVNFLTSQVDYWRMTGLKRKELKRKISKSPLIPLNEFDCENFVEPRGWIDNDFRFNP